MRRRHFLLTGSAAGLAAPAVVRAQDVTSSANAAYRLTTLSRDLEQPWSIAFLPDGRLLITERPGRLRVFANGRLEKPPLAGVPKVYALAKPGCWTSACIPTSPATGCSISRTSPRVRAAR
jgi:glucose/arabinose dehydrogenase